MEGSEPPVVEIEYFNFEDLVDIENPDECLNTVLDRLENSNWIIVCGGLIDVRKLAKFYPNLLTIEKLKAIVALSLKAITNPRSALCKTSIMTISDLFKSHPDVMLSQLDKILLPLLMKAFQDKKFVCEESVRALSSMAFSLQPQETLNQLNIFTSHKNPRVRAKAASTFFLTSSRMNHGEIENYGLPKLMKVAASQVNDQFPEARDSGRKLLLHLKTAFIQLRNEKQSENGNENETNTNPSLHANGNGEGDKLELEKQAWEAFCRTNLSSSEAITVLKFTS